MALRASLQVPKYGLFYFPIDQTTSIIPVKNIQKVVEGNNTSKGSRNEAEINSKMLIFCFTGFTSTVFV